MMSGHKARPRKTEHPQLAQQNHEAGGGDEHTQFHVIFGRHLSPIPSKFRVFILADKRIKHHHSSHIAAEHAQEK